MTPDQRLAVTQEAISWLNTPYHPHARVKGAGVDCAMLLAEVYERAGVIDHVEPGHYSPQFGAHRSEEVFQLFVARYAHQVDAPEPGDCVLFKFGRCLSHGGIMITPLRLIHATMTARVVCYGDLTDVDLAKRERFFYTIRSPE